MEHCRRRVPSWLPNRSGTVSSGVSDEDRLVSNMAVSVDLVDHLAPADAEIGVVRAVTL